MTHYMNTEINDKLDVLIALSAKDCGNDDVEMFRSLDKSDVNLGKNFYAKQRRIVNKYERKPTVTLAVGGDFACESGVTYKAVFVVTAYTGTTPETETVEYIEECP